MSEIYIDFTTHVGLRLSSLFDWSHSQTSNRREYESVLKGMLKNVMLTLIENMQLGSVSNNSGLYDPEQN